MTAQRHNAVDQDEVSVLFHRYKNLVYKTAYLMLGTRGEAEDALQEVFVRVYRSLGSYEPEKAAFSTWLYRIVVSYCLNRRRAHTLFTVPLEPSNQTAIVEAASYETRLADAEVVHNALIRLSDKLRVVVILRYYLDLTYAEIAQVLEIPLGTVRSRLNLAISQLRKELQAASAHESSTSDLCREEA